MNSYLVVSKDNNKIVETVSHLVPFENYNISPDFMRMVGEKSLGIGEVRRLKSFLNKKPYKEATKVVYIPQAESLTLPAQHALLKTLEEPPGESILILATENELMLLDTIVSRCRVIRVGTNEVQPIDRDTKKLVQAIRELEIADRVAMASKYSFPREKAENLSRSMMDYFRVKLNAKKDSESLLNLKEVKQAWERIGANVDTKLVLEHLFMKLK